MEDDFIAATKAIIAGSNAEEGCAALCEITLHDPV